MKMLVFHIAQLDERYLWKLMSKTNSASKGGTIQVPPFDATADYGRHWLLAASTLNSSFRHINSDNYVCRLINACQSIMQYLDTDEDDDL
jgi:hypothetical protein